MNEPPTVVTVTLNPAIDQTLRIDGFAAGRVNRVRESQQNAGGKGVNVACFLADLGDRVVATGFLGRDNPQVFESALAERRVEDRFVRIDGATRTGIKIIEPATQQTTDINFPGLAPSPDAVEALCRQIEDLASPGGWFVLCGSVPPGVDAEIYARLIDRVRLRGGKVVLDTSGEPLSRAIERLPDAVKPNLAELRELTGQPLENPADVTNAARSLIDRGVGLVVVSMGEAGAVFVDRERALLAHPPTVTVASTVGAGDAMVAGIVHAASRSLPLDECARLATALGAYAVTRVGPGLGGPRDHESLMAQVSVESLK